MDPLERESQSLLMAPAPGLGLIRSFFLPDPMLSLWGLLVKKTEAGYGLRWSHDHSPSASSVFLLECGLPISCPF